MSKKGNFKVTNPSNMHVDMLCDYILSTYHVSIKQSLSVLPVYIKTMEAIDKNKHNEVAKIAELFVALKELIEQLLGKEENIFFPYIKKLSESLRYNTKESKSVVGLSKRPLATIKEEHEKIKFLLQEMRSLSNEYTPANDSSPSLKLCYAHLFNFEQDVYKHIFLKENFLFPKVAELEKSAGLMNNF